MSKDTSNRTSDETKKIIEAISVAGGFGNPTAATVNVLSGFNHRGGGNMVPANRDHQGYTFFTKPNLNLSYDNLQMGRRLTFLADKIPDSMASYIRTTLSPNVPFNYNMSVPPIERDPAKLLPRSLAADDRSAFIPLLTNTLNTITGWPDMVMNAFTTKEGLRKETMSWADSIADMNSAFDLTSVFQSIDGDPVLAMFAVWIEYMGRVAVGEMNPYMTSIYEFEVDYNTRIYRVVLDPTKTYVRKIAEACVTWPSAVPLGASFNQNIEQIYTADGDTTSIRFTCTGVRYNDPITIYNFNRIGETFNQSLSKEKRETDMIKLTPAERRKFNYNGYPHINTDNELEWWVDKDDYKAINESLKTGDKK